MEKQTGTKRRKETGQDGGQMRIQSQVVAQSIHNDVDSPYSKKPREYKGYKKEKV